MFSFLHKFLQYINKRYNTHTPDHSPTSLSSNTTNIHFPECGISPVQHIKYQKGIKVIEVRQHNIYFNTN
jgi:hypothetical protein